MRSQYRDLSPVEKAQVAELKQMGEHFCNLCDAVGNPHPEIDASFTQAKLRMREAVMWATNGVTA